MTDSDGGGHRHRVHPRWVWLGLALALVGSGLIGLGVARLSLLLGVIGSVVLVLGVLLGVAGGLMYDARTQATAGTEVEQVVHGDVHQGIAPGDMVPGERARIDAAETTALTRDNLRRSRQRGRVPLAPLAGWIMLGIAVFIPMSQPWFIGHTATGGDSAARDAGAAILLGLSGLRIATGRGRHTIAVAIAALAGLGLLLGGLFADHSGTGIVVVEIGCGVLAILAAIAAGARPRT